MARFSRSQAENPMAERRATVNRDTLETQITAKVDLDGSGTGFRIDLTTGATNFDAST